MGTALTVSRTEHTAVELRTFAAKSGDGRKFVGFWPLHWFWRAIREPKRPN